MSVSECCVVCCARVSEILRGINIVESGFGRHTGSAEPAADPPSFSVAAARLPFAGVSAAVNYRTYTHGN